MAVRSDDDEGPRIVHVLAIGVLFAIGLLRWNFVVFLRGFNCDETQYHEAFELAARGANPYGAPGFLYPYPLAILAGSLYNTVGTHATLVAMRCCNLLGLVAAVWTSVGLVGRSIVGAHGHRAWVLRIAAASFVLLFFPNVGHVMRYANLVGLAVGLGLTALWFLEDRPHVAGVLLGLSLLVKPLLAPAWLALVAHGVFKERRALRVAAISSAVFATALATRTDLLPAMLRVQVTAYELTRSNLLGISRVLYLYDFAPHTRVILVGFAAVLAWGAVAYRWDRGGFAALCAFGSFLAAPLVWPHTLLLLLPVECLAIAHGACSVRSARTRDQRSRAVLVLLLTILGVLTLFNVEVVPFMVAVGTSRLVLSATLLGFEIVAIAVAAVGLLHPST